MLLKTILSPRIFLGLLMVCLGLVYALNSGGETMSDDDHQINHARSFSSLGSTFTVDCFGLFRPVKTLIFYSWLSVFPDNYQAWRLSAIVGLIPLPYLFFGLFFKKQAWLQLLATGFWASAPAATTVVCWMSSTNIIFGGYGFFLYFLLYEKAQKTQLSGRIEKAYVWLFGALLMLSFSCFHTRQAWQRLAYCCLKTM